MSAGYKRVISLTKDRLNGYIEGLEDYHLRNVFLIKFIYKSRECLIIGLSKTI